MARYQVILAYDGTQYCGFQRQANASTVQGAVERALRRIGWQGRAIMAAGRTDSGVHASGQVIAFDLDWNHSPQDLQAAMNAHLPTDIAVLAVHPADTGFHPRIQALSRRYRYHLICQEVPDPLRERYVWRVWPPVELEVMQQVASYITGEHDFVAFGTPPREGGSTLRTVYQAVWRTAVDLFERQTLVFEISANGFLYRMVRRLVYQQVAAGQGKIEPDIIRCALESPPRFPLQGLAPPQGLVLVEVNYPAGEYGGE
jgi:tRNA pseudouridine38-40 synthase